MKRFNQYEPFNIFHFEETKWPYPLHNHSFFEIIFIMKGSGIHQVNENRFDYQEGDVFLLGPQDSHLFEIATPTQFCYLRFTELFFLGNQMEGKEKSWQQSIEYLFHTPYQVCGSLVKDADEKKRLEYLLKVLLDEYDNRKRQFAENIMDFTMRSMVSILARNISAQTFWYRKDGKQHSIALEQLLIYVRQHIYYPEKLRLKHLAEQFNYSPNYLGIYFKRQTSESLQQYILRYKLKLVETRLRYSDWSLSQIAYELGFTDGSHLSKLFKKYYQLSPSEFRKSVEDKH